MPLYVSVLTRELLAIKMIDKHKNISTEFNDLDEMLVKISEAHFYQ